MWNGSNVVDEVPVEGISDLNPEAITQIDNYWLILSDDGRASRKLFNIDGATQITCKKINEENIHHSNVLFLGLLLSKNRGL